MFMTRMIPTLLLKDKGLVKTRKFRNPVYLGDPINITRARAGLGLPLMVTLMDEVNFARISGGGTKVTLSLLLSA